MNQTIKPNVRAFIQYNFLYLLAVSLGVVVVAYLAVQTFVRFEFSPVIWAGVGGVFFLVMWVYWIQLRQSYRKTEYIIQKDRIVARGGGIFSQYEQELIAKNVTHLTLHKPFPEYALYGTGEVLIQAAGAEDVEVHMVAVEQPDALFQQVQTWLVQNGFEMERDKLVHESRPAPRGVKLQLVYALGIGLLVLTGFLVAMFDKNPAKRLTVVWEWQSFVLFFLLAVGGIGSLIYLYGTQMRRRYKLFEQVIVSETQFLFEEQVLIPMRNLSDSMLLQGPIARMLGIHDLTLSCQGSRHEIKFSLVEDANLWKDKLDSLLRERVKKQQEKKAAKAIESTHSKAPTSQSGSKSGWYVERDEVSTADIAIHQRRLLLPPILALLVAFGLLVVGFLFMPSFRAVERATPTQILGLILLGMGGLLGLIASLRLAYGYFYGRAHTFRIKPTGFSKSFRFIVSKDVDFQAKKVTAILVREGILDRWFGSCSIDFWSVGASEHLRFGHISKDDHVLNLIFAKVGLQHNPEARHRVVSSHADVLSILQAGAFFLIPLLIAAPLLATWVHLGAGIAALVVAMMPMVGANIYYRFHQLTLYQQHLWFRTGIFQHVHYFVRYEDIKYVASTSYPWSSYGTLSFEIAGERIIKTNDGEMKISNRFHVRFVPEVRFQHLIVDLLFTQRSGWEQLPQTPSNMDGFRSRELLASGPKFSHMLFTRGLAILILDILAAGAWFVAKTQGNINEKQQLWLTTALAVLGIFSVLGLIMLSLYIRSIRYVLDEQKVSRYAGIFFKTDMRIHYEDIDFIGKKYGVLNKLFGTGNITINTIGSSTTDLTLSNLPDPERFYEELKKHYRAEPGQEDT